ncbi:MAG: CDP-diacylglycerol--glycerol-3-phosphate 3-phosphatidyltransferase [Candidatus Paraimprobicoccus trichonymphae]|uniref:CDP-diacylglycerol--glycerol-3-phosphate 3-phosphatidyltransferase n=1 Tax=Candidatus Paraimprobicoccus trichonymphae TaxID=3033793 RepID=A0AA48I052_9FIRM|nr:MAG: CDP-diacylglycerol--glycerol-3-phosphate 3-phosphatidyltransferase [Candidatus Paraimprobicoccus trichonymphae]
MNVPNLLTLARIILCFAIVVLLLSGNITNKYLISFIIFIIASFTDYYDGKIARRCNKITNFGKFTDPIADKILVISILICFVELKIINSFPVILLILREFLVVILRLMAVEQSKVIAADKLGKLKTISQIFSISVILVLKSFEEFNFRINVFFTSCSYIIFWFSIIISLISGIMYIYNNRRYLKDKM